MPLVGREINFYLSKLVRQRHLLVAWDATILVVAVIHPDAEGPQNAFLGEVTNVLGLQAL